MTRLAARTTALVAAGAVLASCGGAEDGSSTLDEIRNSVSEATGIDFTGVEPPLGTPEELLLDDPQVARFNFAYGTDLDIEELRATRLADVEKDFDIEPAECDPTDEPSYVEVIDPETIAIRTAEVRYTESAVQVSVSENTSEAEMLEGYNQRCGNVTMRATSRGGGAVVVNTVTEVFDADMPSGVSEPVALSMRSATSGELTRPVPTEVSVTMSGVVRERAIKVFLSTRNDSVATEQLRENAHEIFTAQVQKIKAAE